MFLNRIISYGISSDKQNKKATPLVQSPWLESLERCRNSFGLEGVQYEYLSYPTPSPEVAIWIKNSKNVFFFLSEGFLKIATESQVVVLFESLNANNFHEIQKKNKRESYILLVNRLKGESRRYRFWIISFFLYPLERFLKIARI